MSFIAITDRLNFEKHLEAKKLEEKNNARFSVSTPKRSRKC
jgi:hypothetical protein